MGVDKPHKHGENQPSHPKRNLEFFYFEKQGSRYVLRFTRLTVFLIVGLTLFSVVGVLIFSLTNKPLIADEPVNANVRSSPTPFPTAPVIKPPPPVRPVPPRIINQPGYNTPAPSTPTPDNNLNQQLVPRQTPQPQTSKPPG